MKILLNGCAAAAFLVVLAGQARAEIDVRDAPVHAVPADSGDAAPAETAPAPVSAPAPQAPEPARREPSLVKALTEQKSQPVPQPLTPEENAFFDILGHRVTDAASAYETYVRRATAIDSRFGDAGAVRKAVAAGADYQPQQLQEGIIAYAALLALRNDAFVAEVKGLRDPAFADRLSASPQLVLGLRGANEAAADVAGALRAQGEALTTAGKLITQAAYDVQAQGWSKTPAVDPQGILAETKNAAIQPRAASVPAKEHLLASLISAPQAPAAPALQPVAFQAPPGPAPDVVRGLALAALAIMGRTGDDKESAFEALLRDSSSADCLKMAKLNLNQCLSVAGPHYEDVYCTGRHAVGETAQCVSAAGAGTVPAPPPAAPPQQRAEGYGPEQARAYGQPGLQPQDRDDDDTAAPPRYASAEQAFAPPPAYAPPPAPQTYARNDQAYAAPYQDPRGYAPQPQPQYQQPYAQPQYQRQQQAAPYANAPQPYAQPQPAYPAQPPVQYPYGYAARSYYGQ